MNQELHTQFLNAASIMFITGKFDKEIQMLAGQANDCSASINKAKERIDTSKRQYRTMTVFGIILIAIGLEGMALFLRVFWMLAMMLLSMVIVGICLIVVSMVARRRIRKKFKKEFEQTESLLIPAIERMEARINQIKAQKAQFMSENEDVLEFLPYRYQNTQAVGFMLKAIENLRANNLTDVINLYEQEVHYWEQNRILTNHMEMQRIHNESVQYALESIKRNQKQIKSSLRFMQTMQIIDNIL